MLVQGSLFSSAGQKRQARKQERACWREGFSERRKGREGNGKWEVLNFIPKVTNCQRVKKNKSWACNLRTREAETGRLWGLTSQPSLWWDPGQRETGSPCPKKKKASDQYLKNKPQVGLWSHMCVHNKEKHSSPEKANMWDATGGPWPYSCAYEVTVPGPLQRTRTTGTESVLSLVHMWSWSLALSVQSVRTWQGGSQPRVQQSPTDCGQQGFCNT